MPNVKGSSIVSLRKVFEERGKQQEAELLRRLPRDLLDMYRNTHATSWTPEDQQLRLYAIAADVLFPGDPQRLFRLGYEIAGRSYTGLYRVFLRIPTVSFVVNRIAKLWQIQHDTGEASIENFTGHRGEMVVRGFPELPGGMRKVISGHVARILELTGGKEVQIVLVEDDPDAWRWKIFWTRI